MDFDEIKNIVLEEIENDDLNAVIDTHERINIANATVKINNLITIYNVYLIREIDGDTLWINGNFCMKTKDVNDFRIHTLYFKE